ncbi:LCP family protein [Paenibacillus graminis]|uniref:Transcriptional regulator n=1 Tax=Paenibacillus graminis TaxID=189425 RepID=A0A089M9J7_9BACL|nr:LCP family protein [Paenibacillus graminis]AIQ70471.1 transcriptional regulator [Paenibacillus graminis]MEC0170207.1 LCP family protein [Paenibacillus graminis]
MSTSKGSLPPRSGGNQRNGRPQPNSTAKTVQKKKKVKKRGALARMGKMVLTLLIIVILAVLGYAGYLYWKFDHGSFGVDKPVQVGHSASEKPITMLLLGTDNRPKHPSNLTDVIMVVALNPKTQSATVVSLPRDTYVELSGYKRTKINEFYARFKSKEKTSGILAEDEMKTMMGKYLDIDVDYATVLDFQGFRDVVDELGGVDVNISENMCYTDSVDGTDINLTKGPARLNGDDALDYVRYRKSNCKPKTKASDDFDRNKRQNEVLNSLVGQMQSLGGVLKIGKVLDAVDDNMKTDIENAQIKNIISAYWKISKENIEFKPVTGTWRSPYVYINDKELEAAKQSLQDRIAGAAPGGTAASQN